MYFKPGVIVSLGLTFHTTSINGSYWVQPEYCRYSRYCGVLG